MPGHRANQRRQIDRMPSEFTQRAFISDLNGPWSGRRDSNPRPIAWEAIALPLRHSRVQCIPMIPLQVGKVKPW